MLRTVALAAARSSRVRALAGSVPLDPLVERYVAADDDAAIRVARVLAADRLVTLDHLTGDAAERAHADTAVAAYERILARLAAEGLAGRVEVSVRLSALGQSLPRDADKIALDNARRTCEAAAGAGTTVTVDMADHTTAARTLQTVRDLRVDHPWVGVVLQAQLRRTEADCHDLSGSRVQLRKGAYDEPESVAFRDRGQVDRSFARCLGVLMAGDGLPTVATRDPRLIALARRLGRGRPYELQRRHGVRPAAQREPAAAGETVRVHVPYGTAWFGYAMLRLAERG